MLRNLLILSFFLALNVSLYAQNGGGTENFSVYGQVLDGESGQPLEYATVTLLTPEDSSMVEGQATDSKGQFNLKAASGTYLLRINYVSYSPQYINDIEINNNRREFEAGIITLLPGEQSLDEVIIEGKRTQMVLEQDKRVFHVGEDLTSMGATAAELLDNIPGIAVDYEGNVSLRGSDNVRILVNGKPSGLVGVSSSDALRFFPANQIEKVEVITNPSAKYEAQGVGGIINIILKESRQWGLNGNFNAQTGIPDNHGVSANINYRKKWFNVFGSYNFNYRQSPGGGFDYKNFTFPDTTYYMETVHDRVRGGSSNTFRAGSDIYITNKDVVRVSGLMDLENNDNFTDITYRDFNGEGVQTRNTFRSEHEVEEEANYEFNINYEKTLPEISGNDQDHNLTADFQYRKNYEYEAADLEEESGATGEELTTDLFQQSLIDATVESLLGRLDYILPVGESGAFEAGFRGDVRSIDNDYDVFQRAGENEEWQNQPEFTNLFLYDEGLYSAYVTYGDKLDKWSYKGGLRLERTIIKTHLAETNEKNAQYYTNLFPSASLSYDLGNNNTIQASHSRRINRPHFRSLNPFNNFQDTRNFRTGNPDLQPEFTGSYEVGYMNNRKIGTLYTGFFYRHTNGETERITTVDQEGISYSMPVNLATQDAYGLEANYSLDLYDWWSLSTNANFYRAITSGSFEGEDLSSDSYTMSGRATSRFDVGDLFKFQVNSFYRAPHNGPQNRRKAMYMVNLGASRDLFNKKGNVSFSVRDLFNTLAYRSEMDGRNFSSTRQFRWRDQTSFSLSFVYRLKNINERGKRGGGDRGGGAPMDTDDVGF